MEDCAERNDRVPPEQLQGKAIKQDRWNNREADRQAEKAFLEEHKGPGKFSGKYGPQPTQTELVWRMPWGCWLEYNDDQMLSEVWNAALPQPRSSLKIGQALQSIRYKAHESLMCKMFINNKKS